MAYRLKETRDELHIYILGDKKNCSVRRYFWVPTSYVLVEAFEVCYKDISFIVVFFFIYGIRVNVYKTLAIFATMVLYFECSKSRLIETALLCLIFFGVSKI